MRRHHPESGNALWFILLAVVLMGALTLTLSRGGSNSDQTGDFEQMRVQASKVLRTAAGIEQAITQLKMNGGCSEQQISFEADEDDDNVYNDSDDRYYNAKSPTDLSCHLFHRSGAALNRPGAEWRFVTGSVENIGGGGTELLALMPDISADLCKAINRELSLSFPLTDSFNATAYDTEFAGAFTQDVAIGDEGGGGDFPAGKRSGCLTVDTTPAALDGDHVFYHVLMVR